MSKHSDFINENLKINIELLENLEDILEDKISKLIAGMKFFSNAGIEINLNNSSSLHLHNDIEKKDLLLISIGLDPDIYTSKIDLNNIVTFLKNLNYNDDIEDRLDEHQYHCYTRHYSFNEIETISNTFIQAIGFLNEYQYNSILEFDLYFYNEDDE